MVKLVHREVLLAQPEAEYGVDPGSWAGAHAMFVEGLAWSNAGARMVERPLVKITQGKLRHLFAGTLISVTFQKEVKGSGTAGTPPEIGVLLRGCSFGETVEAASVTYMPVSTGQESLSLRLYEDGSIYAITGARGTVSFSMEAGGRIMASFTFTGHVSPPIDGPLIVPEYEATVPPIFIGAGVSLAGHGPVIQSLTFDIGAAVVTPPDANASDGYGEVIINGRDVVFGLNPQATLVAARDWVGAWRDGEIEALTTGSIGPAAGNRVKFSAPAVSSRELSPGEREGIRTFEISGGCAEVEGDDELAIEFT